ncbi:MAG: aminofutalosine synthase MqnE [Candidatus Eisenbacteria bacterium]|uniref:Aminodeoxyfutalosine synthase n=1 Tax=Eiseniibacteriota bacterium TaxID=2212470 RepID=A0A849SWG6_UNCEI|nr:aminofutalosine synthase MqnE [Candidatus Eisenbacteria bacterium]
MRLRDPVVEAARVRLLAGERLSQEDGLRLYDAPVMELGRLADAVARDRHGDRVYFTVNRQLNPTNVCVLACKFCDYAKKPDDPTAYTMTKEQILGHVDSEITEIHIVGGLHNKWRFDDYLNVIRWVKEKKPSLSVKAYTAVEIDFFCRLTKQSVEWVLTELKQVGLDALPGGGAEVFSERVRREIFHQKIGAQRWLEIHETAHRLGIPSNSTLLYGHIETRAERVQHLIMLRDLEDRAPGFFAFIPLAFQPGTTGLVRRQVSAIEDLKTIAISRLVFDNVKHVKSYWIMLGQDTAAAGIHFGASDLDGTIGQEKIAHAALARSPIGMAEAGMVQMIREAGKIPVQRDALYRVIREYPRREVEDALSSFTGVTVRRTEPSAGGVATIEAPR